jgi:hypothetical protein
LRKALSIVLLLPFLSATLPAADALDQDLQKGIAQVDDGDYDAAIFTLDTAARRLAEDKSRVKDLSQAYLYLGIAYIGKGHEAAGKAKFREAIAQIKDLSLSADRFPPKVIDIFEAAREEELRQAPASNASPAPVAASAAPEAKKGGGSKKTLLVIGGVVVAGGAAAAAAAGGGGGSSSAAVAPTTTTLAAPPVRTVQVHHGTICGYSSVGRQHGTCSYFKDYDVVVTKNGTLDATVTWSDGSIFITMELQDQHDVTVAESHRGNNSSALTAEVTPQTACSDCAYHLTVDREDSKGPMDYTLTLMIP